MQTLKRAMIKEELVALTGDLEKAIILNQLLYWSERVKDFDKFLMEEKMVAEINGDIDSIELINGWIYKDMEELKEETMITCSVSTLSRKMNDLIKNGWIDRRRNPKHRWDKRYQYRVNLIKISMDLMKIGYTLQGYKIDLQMLINANLQNDGSNMQNASSNLHNDDSNLQNDSSNLQNDSSNLHSDGAISEITTETTIEITSETTTTTIDEENKNRCCGDSENKELEIDKNLSVIAKEFEQSGFGTINIKVKELLEELLEEYSVEWIMQAFKVSVEANVRNLRFVRGILRNWQNNGGIDIGGGSIAKSTDGGNGSIGQESSGHYEKLDLSHIGYKGESDNFVDDDDLI